MTDSIILGEKLLSLLAETARTSTYKSALLLALIDCAQENSEGDSISVSALAERVAEFYWPQTLAYPTTGAVLQQSSNRQAAIVSRIAEFRREHGYSARSLPQAVRRDESWARVLGDVETTLAEWPIPRLQKPFAPFLYEFDWPWQEAGGWSVRAYRGSRRSVKLLPGVAAGLTSLSPLLRPFITRWWADKAAQLNPDVEAARSVLEFEEFLFGRDRVALERVGEGLLDLQSGRCLYCTAQIGNDREIDHFIPWSHSGDDGLDNLVASCRSCNNGKRATLPGPAHLSELLDRNRRWDGDLGALAEERRWPRNYQRSVRIARSAYLGAADERPLWIHGLSGARYEVLGAHREVLVGLLG